MKQINIVLGIFCMVLISSVASGATIDCNGCVDCSDKINSAAVGDTVVLTTNITECDGNCINFIRSSGITFDGGNNTINVSIFKYGVRLYGLSDDNNNNTVKNLRITGFRSGIYMYKAFNTTISNIVAYGNSNGIQTMYSSCNMICNCTLQNNSAYDFYFMPYLLSDCNNTLVNVTGSGNREIGYYNRSVNLSDKEFSALYLCNADNSTLYNISIIGADTLKNNALKIYYTDNSTFENITSSHNAEGISLDDSDYNMVRNIECKYNNDNGMYIDHSQHNLFESITTSHNKQCGMYFVGSADYNVITNVLSYYNGFAGIYFDRCASNTLNNSKFIDNIHGIKVRSDSYTMSVNNSIYNNHFDNVYNVVFAYLDMSHRNTPNNWNTTNKSGTNIMGGSWIGGNYWSDYNWADRNNDGFGDTPRIAGIYNIDYLPLMKIEEEAVPGDINGDGILDMFDVMYLAKHIIGVPGFEEIM